MIETLNNDELSFDIINLPSNGKFYKNKCSRVKIYHLTMADEELLTSVNLIQSGKLIDVLLERKVKPADENFVKPTDMLIGDRLALLVFLRIGMSNIYNMNVRDIDGSYFVFPFDLTTLGTRETDYTPNENYEFNTIVHTNITEQNTNAETNEVFFKRQVIENEITFRLMNGKDESDIRESQKRFQNQESKYNQFKLEKLVTSWNGNREKGFIMQQINKMPLLEARRLLNTINEYTPTLDLNVSIPSPKGNVINTMVDFGSPEFFFPTI